MKLFIDSAQRQRDRRGRRRGASSTAVTTNPSLVAREGRSYRELVAEICGLVGGAPVSAEVIATDVEGMEREGRELATIAENVVVKLPITRDGIRVCARFAEEGIPTNLTLCFSAAQRCWSPRRAPPTSARSSAGSTTSATTACSWSARWSRSTTPTSSRPRCWSPRCGTRSTSSRRRSPARRRHRAVQGARAAVHPPAHRHRPAALLADFRAARDVSTEVGPTAVFS